MYAVIWARTAASCERSFDCKLAFLRYLWMNTEGNIFRLNLNWNFSFPLPPLDYVCIRARRQYGQRTLTLTSKTDVDVFAYFCCLFNTLDLFLSCFSCKCVSSLFGVTHTIQSLFPGLVKLERVLQLDHKEGEDVLNHCPHLQLILLLIPPCEH